MRPPRSTALRCPMGSSTEGHSGGVRKRSTRAGHIFGSRSVFHVAVHLPVLPPCSPDPLAPPSHAAAPPRPAPFPSAPPFRPPARPPPRPVYKRPPVPIAQLAMGQL
eukprot:3116326-Pyramimonas_sp.AAC.1